MAIATLARIAACLALIGHLTGATASAQEVAGGLTSGLEGAQQAYYNANYVEAADQALVLRTANPEDLGARELRTSAILFQIKRLVGEDTPDRDRALANCSSCPALIQAFREETDAGRASARRRMAADAQDLEAVFFLGKLDLNYVWLHLGPLDRRTGWSEYREARRSMETVLRTQAGHVRARVARAWIEYIVDTKVMFGVRWMLGGGDRKKALASVKEAAATSAPFFDVVEARFALWEMLAREKRFAEAVEVARGLIGDFPQNKELAKFIERHSKPR